MKKILMFSYSIVAYFIGFASILYWILSVSNLVPQISIDQETKIPVLWAILNNLMLISLFGVQHSVMSRQWFKDFFASHFPRPIERSTFVLMSGILLFNLVINWQPLGGTIWTIPADTIWYYGIYILFFLGWIILFVSSFLINHFDLFGLRQTFLELQNKPYTQLEFRIISFYKHVRHPLYFGMLLGMWATPVMSVTHLFLALAITAYVLVGTTLEERDLVKAFGQKYKHYQASKPMLVPFTKRKRGKSFDTVSKSPSKS
ncbi:methyltransferase family protein [Flagellimonas allohymeniacidonis]|uniref:Isoprenylcysteine carboxylmethyltransferase family protein n=1 Tax=Flagellimonas allohymeniacidonis TaxID=2517819 RepID=A0A4Q8QG38_9FLAO|nr:isoprenylcysteine carboxylmethyltransferase family protein [Allomuricauda hymeniacidonis]TAI49495.1 isoprenylcysteine carboxylmethyltransferase family protein [Allomuricauda hymeniacidonis]